MGQKAWDVPDLLDEFVKIMTTAVKYLTTDYALKHQGPLSIWAQIRHSGTAEVQSYLQPIQDGRNGWRV